MLVERAIRESMKTSTSVRTGGALRIEDIDDVAEDIDDDDDEYHFVSHDDVHTPVCLRNITYFSEEKLIFAASIAVCTRGTNCTI